MVSDDPATPQLTLTLEGEIVVDVAIDPSRLGLADLVKGQKATQTFTLTVTEPDKVKVTKVFVKDERFSVVRKSGDPAGNAVYELKFAGSQELGRIAVALEVEYTGSDMTRVEVPIRANIVGDLIFRKNVSFFKKEGKFNTVETTIASRSGKKVKILRMEDPDKRLKLEEIKNKEGKDGVLLKADVIDVDAKYDSIVRGKILVKTNIPKEPDIEIGYTIIDRAYTPPRTPRMPGLNLARDPAKASPARPNPEAANPAQPDPSAAQTEPGRPD